MKPAPMSNLTVRIPSEWREHPLIAQGKAGDTIRKALAIVMPVPDFVDRILALNTALHQPNDRGPCICSQCKERRMFREMQESLKKYLANG